MKVLVTGGAGFIGSSVIRHVIRNTDASVVNVDCLTYAATPEALEDCASDGRYVFEQTNICDGEALARLFKKHRPDAVMHLAAESHVDRSIDGPSAFIETNIVGTYRLLEVTRAYLGELEEAARKDFRFHHVSTDEVFGTLRNEDPAFTEESPYLPNSPYSASKASSDHLVRAWNHTFGLPVVMSNCSNNYGPWQFPEKLIPLMIANALEGRPLPVYGKGENVRDWLFVDDHARALWTVLTRGRVGESYNIGGNSERQNIEVVRTICRLVDEKAPALSGGPREELIEFVTDRPAHDFRYAIDTSKVERDLGWRAEESFESGLEKTVDWYLSNRDWWEKVRAEQYDGQRLGLGKSKPSSASAR